MAAERDKLRSSGVLARLVTASLIGVIAITVLSVSQGIAEPDAVAPAGADYSVQTDAETSSASRDEEIRRALTQWTALGLVALLVGIFSVAGEFQTGTATSTFLATPRRTRVLVAKALAGLGVLVPLGLVAAAIDTAIVAVAVDGPLGFSVPELIVLAAGGVLTVALSLLAGLGLGAILRRPVHAIVLALVVVALIEPALIPRTDEWGGASYLPTGVLAAIVQSSPSTGFATSDLLSPGMGVAIATLYTGFLLALGARVIERVDVR